MTTPVVEILVTGKVDPELLRGLASLGDSLRAAARSSEEAAKKAESTTTAFQRFEGAIEGGRSRVENLASSYFFLSGALSDVSSRLSGVADLAAEQERLSAQSRELGLDFDRAASAAGIFSDEVDALRAATQFAGPEIRLTQQELDALERVAGASAARLGVSVTGAVDMLTSALIRGREAGLQRFGGELAEVAGQSHSVGERLAALVQRAQHVTAATDNSGAAVARLADRFDDYKRTVATAFMDELARVTSLGGASRSTAEDLQNLTATLAEVGRGIAQIVGMTVGGIRYLVVELVSEVAHLGNALSLVSDETAGMWSRMSRDALDNLETMQADREGQGPGTTILRGGTLRTATGVSGGGMVDTRLDRYQEDTVIQSRGGSSSDPAFAARRAGVSYQPRNAAEAEALRIAEADAAARDRRDAPAAAAARAGSARAAACA